MVIIYVLELALLSINQNGSKEGDLVVEGKTKFVGVVKKAGELYWVKVSPEFYQGLKHLNKFSHVIVTRARAFT